MGKVDLFSLGVIAYILLTGHAPNKVNRQKRGPIETKLAFERREKFYSRTSGAKEFVKRLLQQDPATRPTADEALKDQWLWTEDRAPISPEVLSGLTDFTLASGFRRTCLNMVAWSLTKEERAQLREGFEQFDKNGEGKIKLKDMRRVLEDQYELENMSDEVKALFAAADRMEDQELTEIHYTDFLGAVLQGRVQMHMSALWAAFDRFDVEGKGVLTREGLQKVLGSDVDGPSIDEVMSEVDPQKTGQVTRAAFIDYMTQPVRKDVAAQVIDEELMQAEKSPGGKTWAPDHKREEDLFMPMKLKAKRKPGYASW